MGKLIDAAMETIGKNSSDNEIIVRMPGEHDISGKSAWMSVHIPKNGLRNKSAVVICPGGGYEMLADSHEGVDCADFMNNIGVAAFVLRYRLAPEFRYPCQLEDARWAIKYARANAARFMIDPGKIGIWGFSAGGHLASTLATHYDLGNPSGDEDWSYVSSRPDFLILAYPVITMKMPFTHVGTRNNLLGQDPDPSMIENLSNEMHVTQNTPPAFIFHTGNDEAVPVENSVLFYMAMRDNDVPAEMHIYEKGPHGVGLGVDYPHLRSWPELLKNWMVTRSLI